MAANFSDQNQLIKDPRIGKAASVLVQAGEQGQYSAGTLSMPPFSGVILSVESA